MEFFTILFQKFSKFDYFLILSHFRPRFHLNVFFSPADLNSLILDLISCLKMFYWDIWMMLVRFRTRSLQIYIYRHNRIEQTVWSSRLLSQKLSAYGLKLGDSDVGDIVMLMTLWWWVTIGDRFEMLVIFLMYEIGHQHLRLITNSFGLEHPSPTLM